MVNAECEVMLRERILELAMKRGTEKSICPSEVARSLFKDWREHMDDCRHQTIYHVNLFTKIIAKRSRFIYILLLTLSLMGDLTDAFSMGGGGAL